MVRSPADIQPRYDSPSLIISFFLPAAIPEFVEQEATSPLENALSQITDIKKITSISKYDQGTIELSFSEDVDLEFKKFEVVSTIRQLYPKLYPKLSYPMVEQRANNDNENNHIPFILILHIRIFNF